MGAVKGAELLVFVLVALLCTLLRSGGAKTTHSIKAVDWPGDPIFTTVGGAHGWNPTANNSFFQAWADGALINASLGHVLVFQSSSASERTVNVLTTTDRSLNETSICGEAKLTSYYGTNHFSSNVSLQPPSSCLPCSGRWAWFTMPLTGIPEAW